MKTQGLFGEDRTLFGGFSCLVDWVALFQKSEGTIK